MKNIAQVSFICGSLYLVKFSSARRGPRENYIEITIKMNKSSVGLTDRSAMAAVVVAVLC